MEKKKIVLVTTAHLTSNPRLVKEAKSLLKANFNVKIISLQQLAYLKHFDKDIIKDLHQADIKLINCDKSTLRGKILNIKRLLRKIWISINPLSYLTENVLFPEFKYILKKEKADLYIAHTIQALPIVQWAAKFNQSKFAFDAEDYHREESTDKRQNQSAKIIEDKYLVNASYISAASPFIGKCYQENFPTKKVITLNNYFEKENKKIETNEDQKLIKLVWFSQTIGTNRGLAEFLLKLANFNASEYEVHLRGSCSNETKAEILKDLSDEWRKKIFFYPQCSSYELNSWLQKFDVGLALENSVPNNRNLCITNKIFQYLDAGLAIIATATIGQKWVMQQCPSAGFILDQDTDLMNLQNWQKDRKCLEFAKKAAVLAATHTFNWKFEQKKLIETIKQIDLD
ncbi:hypothetical protein [Pedobacter miscanthi]|uniref:Glycosyltransferase n=1 Tax=Pedobacter miscanthi TaxID=2259170 RepID=A0A366L877_9SPHI|nr:hypothetical protein [Pedobacter miscanthi]RBQ10000.1 hypothetical protein DRW42_06065 [Pedobacter miscanthi]